MANLVEAVGDNTTQHVVSVRAVEVEQDVDAASL
jgi:hypothetical protein